MSSSSEIIGQITLPLLTGRILEKLLITACLIACTACLLPLAAISGSLSFLCLCRLLYGHCYTVLLAYVTAWMETFGENKRVKSVQYHSLIIAQALSYFIGYALVALMITQEEMTPAVTPSPAEGGGDTTPPTEESWFKPWRLALFFQIGSLIPCVLLVMSLPSKYFELEARK